MANDTANHKKVHEKYHKKTRPVRKIISANNFTYRLLIKSLKHIIVKRKLKILDIGCGAGTLGIYLASLGNEVVGIDISERAINACKITAKNLHVSNIKFKSLDFMKNKIQGKYDLIIFSEVIEHLPDDKLALTKINDLLKPKGILLLSTPSTKAPLYRLGLTKSFDKEVGHLRRYSKRDIATLVRGANFKIIDIRPTEGILRNFLFVNSYAGKLVKYIQYVVSDVVTVIDNFLVQLCGESNYIILAIKK